MARFNKRIFISYSHDSDEHRARVRQLADSLRRDGLDCRIDQYEAMAPPEGWPLWMEKEIELANVVLLVCTESYLRRVRKEENPGVGREVCWEANLIYASLYESRARNSKFVPVVFREDDCQYVPAPLGITNIFAIDGDDGYRKLYAELTDQYLAVPELGTGKAVMMPELLPLFGQPRAVESPAPSKKPLSVFLSHASDDKPRVRELYQQLKREGLSPWLDEEDLLPGQEWEPEIRRAVRCSDIVLVCLSNHSISKAGYVQKEIRIALDMADEQPEGTIFIIPVRLEDCPVPDRLSRWQWVDLFEESSYAKLLKSLT